MSTDDLRKRELEFERLAADCGSLADDLEDPTLQKHYRRMAEVWSRLARPTDTEFSE